MNKSHSLCQTREIDVFKHVDHVHTDSEVSSVGISSKHQSQ